MKQLEELQQFEAIKLTWPNLAGRCDDEAPNAGLIG
jgi:hypothetical protein